MEDLPGFPLSLKPNGSFGYQRQVIGCIWNVNHYRIPNRARIKALTKPSFLSLYCTFDQNCFGN
ncbi:hypothetical protein BDE02_10G127500 [Populus trichocarpa]|nr:hypothetical protein BDE02_10G127500 [Populus trichocarpa]